MLTDDRAATTHNLDLLTLLDEMQEVVETSPRVPLSDRVVISSDLLLDLVDAIRNAIPRDVIEAERILQERFRLVEDAREEAEHLLASAREQSRFMLQEHNIVKAAELRSEKILNQARREADEQRALADEYVQRLLARCEQETLRLTDEIRRAAANLAEHSA